MTQQNNRPRFLNLFKIRLPITGVASIGHRLSGVLLVMMIPLGIYLLDLSLRDPGGYQHALAIVNHPLAKALSVLLAWGFMHHFLAGVRALLLDIDIGVARSAARRSAWLVVVGGLIAALLLTMGWRI